MIILLMSCYLACVYVAFKFIKIKVTSTSVAVAALIGVCVLGGIVIGWNLAAPMSSQMVLRRHVLQVTPSVREFVSKVHVKMDQHVEAGAPLFDILPNRFENALKAAQADLLAAQTNVSESSAGVNAAKAAVREALANTAAARAALDSAVALQKESAGAISKLKVEAAKEFFRAAEANEKLQSATLKRAEYSFAASNHSVDVAKAALDMAKFNRESCTYRSPVDGQVVNWQIKEGMPVASWRFASNGTLMDMSDTAVVAVFPQNLLKNVRAGDLVEMAFKRRPGQIATGKVEAVVKYTGEGQMVATSKLPTAADIGSDGFLVARIRLDDEALARELPLGAAGTTAIYTGFGKPLHVITKIALRMKAWLNYLPF